MAELVGEQLKRSLHETQWRRYENGESEPTLDIIQAAAELSGLSASYIAFGEQQSLDITEEDLRYLTPEEIERAERIVAERERTKAKRVAEGGAKGGGKRRA